MMTREELEAMAIAMIKGNRQWAFYAKDGEPMEWYHQPGISLDKAEKLAESYSGKIVNLAVKIFDYIETLPA